MIHWRPSIRLSTVAFLVGVVILLADIYLVYLNCQNLIIGNQWIAQTRYSLRLIEEVKELLLDVPDRPSAYRPAARIPEHASDAGFGFWRLHNHLDELRRVVEAHYPVQAREFSAGIDALLQCLSVTAAGPGAQTQSARGVESALLQNLDHLDHLLAQMEQIQITELQNHSALVGAAESGLIWSLLIAAATAVMLLAGVLALARQEQRHHQRFLVTLASIGDGVIVTDARGRISLLNPIAEALTGWSSAVARGRLLDEVFRLKVTPVSDGAAATDDQAVGQTLQGQLLSRSGRSVAIERSIAPLRRHLDESPQGMLDLPRHQPAFAG